MKKKRFIYSFITLLLLFAILPTHRFAQENLVDNHNDDYVSVIDIQDEQEENIHVHNFESHPAKKATCDNDGYNEYFTCTGSECRGKYFVDVNGEKVEKAWDNIVIKSSGHKYNSSVVEATCEKDGYTLFTCSECGKKYTDKLIVAPGHNYQGSITPPTCDKDGYTTYTCLNCGDTYTDNIVKAFDHTTKHVARKEATATKEGNIEYWYCEVCGRYYYDRYSVKEIKYEETKIPAKGGVDEEPVQNSQNSNSNANNLEIIGSSVSSKPKSEKPPKEYTVKKDKITNHSQIPVIIVLLLISAAGVYFSVNLINSIKNADDEDSADAEDENATEEISE